MSARSIEPPGEFVRRLQWEGVDGRSLPDDVRERDEVLVRERDGQIARAIFIELCNVRERPETATERLRALIVALGGPATGAP